MVVACCLVVLKNIDSNEDEENDEDEGCLPSKHPKGKGDGREGLKLEYIFHGI